MLDPCKPHLHQRTGEGSGDVAQLFREISSLGRVRPDHHTGQPPRRPVAASTGPVIPPDKAGQMFQPFERLNARHVHHGNGHHNGHGLGLSIVRADLPDTAQQAGARSAPRVSEPTRPSHSVTAPGGACPASRALGAAVRHGHGGFGAQLLGRAEQVILGASGRGRCNSPSFPWLRGHVGGCEPGVGVTRWRLSGN